MVCPDCGGAGHHYEIDPAEPVLPLAEAFPNQAFDAIALAGFANLALRNCQAQAGIGFAIGPCEQGQPAVRGLERLLENTMKIGGRGEAEGSGEPETGGYQTSDGQPFTTLGTAGLDDIPATPGPHPDSESVSPYTLDFARLVCSFHLEFLPAAGHTERAGMLRQRRHPVNPVDGYGVAV